MSTTSSHRLRVGLEVWGADPAALVETARTAEAAGLDAVYLGESPTGLNAETWTMLGVIAASTATLRFGPVITNLLPDYRSPVLVARQAATLAAASAGRLDFRTGVGAAGPAGRAWWRPAGVEYGDYAERWDETDRQLRILRSLWSGDVVAIGDGRFRLDLDHPPIPVTVSARTERGAVLAERHADQWETSWCTAHEWRALDARLDLPPRIGRSLEIDGFIGPDRTAADAVWRQATADRAAEDLDRVRAKSLHGTPDQVASQIAAYADVGVDQLVVALHDPHDVHAIAALGRAVAH